MKKSTAHGRKLKRTGGYFNGAAHLNTISRCRPYSDEVIPGAVIAETTQAAADKSLKIVSSAYRSLQSGQCHPDEADDFNLLAHALGVSELRAIEISGEAARAMLPILAAGNAALEKIKARRIKWSKWEMLPAESETVFDALELYETILQASSPAQMDSAVNDRLAWLMRKDADRVAAAKIYNETEGVAA